MGRPRKRVPRTIHGMSGYDVIKGLAAKGVRECDIARALGMCKDTWTKNKREDPKAQEALDTGRGVMHGKLVGKAYDKAMAGDNMMLMFLLNNLFGYSKKDSQPEESRIKVEVRLPAPLNRDEYKQLAAQWNAEKEIDVTPKEIEGEVVGGG